jgi:hypothetical protein
MAEPTLETIRILLLEDNPAGLSEGLFRISPSQLRQDHNRLPATVLCATDKKITSVPNSAEPTPSAFSEIKKWILDTNARNNLFSIAEIR